MASIDTSPAKADTTAGGPAGADAESVTVPQPDSEQPRPGWARRLRALAIGRELFLAAIFVGISVGLRGGYLATIIPINVDEIELMAQARAAMHSPIPFTTWTTTTTGPVWVLGLALLGAIGFPMTAAFAHLVAAVLLGLIGYLGFTLARRAIEPTMSAVFTGFWWLPIVLTLPAAPLEIGTMATELLPCALILAAATMRVELLARRPSLYVAVGLACGLSIGAKYQALPVALSVLAVQLILVGNFQWRVLLRNSVLWGAGATAPFVILGLLMVGSSDVSGSAIQQNLNFLSAYGSGRPLQVRFETWGTLVTTLHITILVLLVCWLGSRSTGRVQICRLILVGGGLAAVFGGGMGFPHYLFFVYAAVALAMGMPLKPDAQLVPFVRNRFVAAGTALVLLSVAWFACFGTNRGTAELATSDDLALALSKDSVPPRDPDVFAACPAGSHVLVWGWAGELYVNYDWSNAIPFMNISQLTMTPKNYESGLDLARSTIDDPATDCVVDAVGSPFYFLDKGSSLTTWYPQVSNLLDEEYRTLPGAFACQICTVYVRR